MSNITPEVQAKLQILVEEYAETHKVVPRGTTSLLFDGIRVYREKVFKKIVGDDLTVIQSYGLLSDYVSWGDKEKSEASEFLSSYLRRIHQTKELGRIGDVDLPDSTVNMEEYVLFIDMETMHAVTVFRKTGLISRIHATFWEKHTSKETKALLPPMMGFLVFNPYQTTLYSEEDFNGTKIQNLNLYVPPAWMKVEGGDTRIVLSDTEIEELTCPEIVMDFMSHLFPDPKCRDFVFSWMHYALVSRAETYLVLNGKKGAGKGILCDVLLSSLVGEGNYKIAPESILNSDFNAVLDKARMLVMDEIKIDNLKHLNKLKKYINSKQNIEKKGIDADTVVETFSSNVISNNSVTDMMLEYDERRFSVPELTETPLIKSWGQRKIDALLDDMKVHEVQTQFGFWILHKAKEKGSTPFSVWKAQRFNKIVYVSLTEWQKTIVDAVISGTHSMLSIKELRSMYKNRVESINIKFPTNLPKIEAFIENYLYEGEHSLGQLVYEGGECFIVPSSKYNCEKADKDTDFTGLL